MSMSKQDFVALADTIRDTKPEPYTGNDLYAAGWEAGKLQQWEKTRDALAVFCKGQNYDFKRDRWLSYIAGECGPGGGTIKPPKLEPTQKACLTT
jgi:hypothetical protein